MNLSVIVTAIACIGGVGLFIGIFLGVFSKFFKVETDPREDAIIDALPGNNCGGCGYPGCSGLAAAIVAGEAPVNGCPVGGAKVGNEIASIMGVEAGEQDRQVAYVKCLGTCDLTVQKYDYFGIEDCQMMSFIPNGGSKKCSYGCIGFGSCVKVCSFDAISILNGVASVNSELCKGCGKCSTACPRKLIEMVSYKPSYIVTCSSKDKGPLVNKACKTGCLGCGLCAKVCENDAITVENNLAGIDQSKCIACGKCAEKCPKKAIIKIG